MVLTLMRQDSRAGILILQLPAGVMAEFERLKKVNGEIMGGTRGKQAPKRRDASEEGGLRLHFSGPVFGRPARGCGMVSMVNHHGR